jgi:hypothetical protein
MKGLFINTEKAVCSIHESGLMVFNCLEDSTEIQLDYREISKNSLAIPRGYDFYLFNYHFVTTSWLDTTSIRRLPGLKGTIILEVSPNDPFVACSPFDFDFYCVLDPSMTFKHKKVFIFPRPLDDYSGPLSNVQHEIPVIGSFGFATRGKGFEHVVEAVNKEFEEAIVRINIPHGTYTDPSHNYAKELAKQCFEKAKPGIKVNVTHNFLSKEQLIYWCSENTINCFLYDRNMPGLAATTDQAITSERPLSISDNPTFRHIAQYLPPYPQLSLKEAIQKTSPVVRQIKKDWSKEKFKISFEKMINSLLPAQIKTQKTGSVGLLLLNKNSLKFRIKRYFLKAVRLYYKSFLYAAFH